MSNSLPTRLSRAVYRSENGFIAAQPPYNSRTSTQSSYVSTHALRTYLSACQQGDLKI